MRILLILLLVLGIVSGAEAQVTIPNTFSPFTLISASSMNANFTELGTKNLNRTGGTLTGNITVNSGVTIDGADISTYLLGSGKLAATSVEADALDVAGGITVGTGNVALVDTSGKIPALSSTYFADLSGTNLTTLNASNLSSGTIPTVRLGSGSASSSTFLRGDNTWVDPTSLIDSVPTSLVAYSVNGSCPSGWSEYTEARGRAIMGLPLGGTSEGTVGTALTDLQNKTHTHTIPSTSWGSGTFIDGAIITSIQEPDSFGERSFPESATLDNRASGTASTSDVIAYIQLITCVKS